MRHHPFSRVMFFMFLDLLFPQRCIGCGTYDTVACSSCIHTHSAPTISTIESTEAISAIIALGPYANPFWRSIIEHFKFHGIRELGIITGTLLTELITRTYDLPIHTSIIPIPLHKKRIQERGYNQALLIARTIALHTHFPIVEALQRTKHTRPQSKQAHTDRTANIENAFVCMPPTDSVPECILLIDDVYTTGATIHEAVSTLRTYYSAPIIVLVIARGG